MSLFLYTFEVPGCFCATPCAFVVASVPSVVTSDGSLGFWRSFLVTFLALAALFWCPLGLHSVPEGSQNAEGLQKMFKNGKLLQKTTPPRGAPGTQEPLVRCGDVASSVFNFGASAQLASGSSQPAAISACSPMPLRAIGCRKLLFPTRHTFPTPGTADELQAEACHRVPTPLKPTF